MNLKMVTGIIALFLFAARPDSLRRRTQQRTRTRNADTTGCLQRGDDANEYNLTANDGGTWEIKSDSVKLGEHVGHTVKVVGVV